MQTRQPTAPQAVAETLLPVALVCGPAARAFRQAAARAYSGSRIGIITAAADDAEGARQPDQVTLYRVQSTDPEGATGSSELLEQLAAIAAGDGVDCVLIECDRENHPGPLASLLSTSSPTGHVGERRLRLTSVVTVVESVRLVDWLLNRRRVDEGASPWLLAEQIEYADIVALADASAPSDVEHARAVAEELNPRATVVDLSREELPADFLAATRCFDIDAAESGGAVPQRHPRSNGATRPSQGFARMTFEARRPFHPQRFADLLKSPLEGLFRAKGFFWLATQMDLAAGLSIAGAEKRAVPLSEWWAALAAREPANHAKPERIASAWREPYGDRRQSLTFLGLHLDEAALRARLHECLLTDEEMAAGEQAWASMPDPFAAWRQPSAAADAHTEHGCCHHEPDAHHEHHHDAGEHECGHHGCRH